MSVARRSFLKMLGASGAVAASGIHPAFGQGPGRFNVLAVPVHAEMLRGGPGGNIIADWEAANNTTIEWLTFANNPLAERLLRELNLRSTNIDAAFLFDPWASPNTLNLIEPLNAYLEADPIEEFEDFFDGPLQTLTRDDNLYGLPIRQNIAGLHYNEEYFEERGLTRPPETMEELLEYAEQLTYTRADGTPVAGLVFPNTQSNYTHFVRAWNADFVDESYTVRADEAPMIEAASALRQLYQDGILPRQFTALSDNDSITWMQTGRAAMTITTMARSGPHNDPRTSMFVGKIKISNMPIMSLLRDQYDIAPVGLNFWSLIIPRNSQNKERAWSFIRELATKENTRRMAMNGNGPMRRSLYDDPDHLTAVEYAREEQRGMEVARVSLPAFDGSARAQTAIRDEMEAAIVGIKSPEQAMNDLAETLRPLMPT